MIRITHFWTNELKVTTPDYVQINLDGEYADVFPCTFWVLLSRLYIFSDDLPRPTSHTESRACTPTDFSRSALYRKRN
jgi:hypothetical protein